MNQEYKKVTVKGIGASSGIVKGIVKIVLDQADSFKISQNDILVTSTIDPSWTNCLIKAKAIVTDNGGFLSHVSIVAREFGIPCVVGTGNATEKLQNDMNVIVDGFKGIVYENEENDDIIQSHI